MNAPPPPPPQPLHPDPDALAAYAHGYLGAADATAVELHTQQCQLCRSRVNQAADPARLAWNWAMVGAEIDAPRRGFVERWVARFGLPADTARLMAATPAMRRSWFIAMAVALLFGLSAAGGNRPSSTVLFFLALAPLIPVMGVALAYGPGVDPSYEITVATPVSGFRLVVVRTVAVVATSAVLSGAVSLLLWRRDGAVVAAWLVPALALSALCLALMTVLPPRLSGVVAGGGWLAVVIVVSQQTADQLALFGPLGQVVMAAVGVLAAAFVWLRRGRFDIATAEVA